MKLIRKNSFTPFEKICKDIYQTVVRKYPKLKNTFFSYCTRAQMEHKKDARAFAHTFHHYKYTPKETAFVICYAHEIKKLPVKNIRGIMWHEFGHIIDYIRHKGISEPYSESVADLEILRNFGVLIKYDNNRIEYI